MSKELQPKHIPAVSSQIERLKHSSEQITAGTFTGKSTPYKLDSAPTLEDQIEVAENLLTLQDRISSRVIPHLETRLNNAQKAIDEARKEAEQLEQRKNEARIKIQGFKEKSPALFRQLKERFEAEYGESLAGDETTSSTTTNVKPQVQERKEASSTNLSTKETLRVIIMLNHLNGITLEKGKSSMQYNIPEAVVDACHEIIANYHASRNNQPNVSETVQMVQKKALEKLKNAFRYPDAYEAFLDSHDEYTKKVVGFIYSQREYIFDLLEEKQDAKPQITKERQVNGFEKIAHVTHPLSFIQEALKNYTVEKSLISKPAPSTPETVSIKPKSQRITTVYRGKELTVTVNTARAIELLAEDPTLSSKQISEHLGIGLRAAVNARSWAIDYIAGVERRLKEVSTASATTAEKPKSAEKSTKKRNEEGKERYKSKLKTIEFILDHPDATFEEIRNLFGYKTKNGEDFTISQLRFAINAGFYWLRKQVLDHRILSDEEKTTLAKIREKFGENIGEDATVFTDYISKRIEGIKEIPGDSQEKIISIDPVAFETITQPTELEGKKEPVLEPLMQALQAFIRNPNITREELLNIFQEESNITLDNLSYYLNLAMRRLTARTLSGEASDAEYSLFYDEIDKLPGKPKILDLITEWSAGFKEVANKTPYDEESEELSLVLKQDEVIESGEITEESDETLESAALQTILPTQKMKTERKPKTIEDHFSGIGSEISEAVTRVLAQPLDRFTQYNARIAFNVSIQDGKYFEEHSLIKPVFDKDNHPRYTPLEMVAMIVMKKLGMRRFKEKDVEKIKAAIENEIKKQSENKQPTPNSPSK